MPFGCQGTGTGTATGTFGSGDVGQRTRRDTAGKHIIGIIVQTADGYNNPGTGTRKSVAQKVHRGADLLPSGRVAWCRGGRLANLHMLPGMSAFEQLHAHREVRP